MVVRTKFVSLIVKRFPVFDKIHLPLGCTLRKNPVLIPLTTTSNPTTCIVVVDDDNAIGGTNSKADGSTCKRNFGNIY
jgi:hypothetical protein